MPDSARRLKGPVKVIDQSQTPHRTVDEGRPSVIAKKWIPKALGTHSFIKHFPKHARWCYVSTTREGVRETWKAHGSNTGNFPDHRVVKTPDGFYGLFQISTDHLVNALNKAVRDGKVKKEYKDFRFEGTE